MHHNLWRRTCSAEYAGHKCLRQSRTAENPDWYHEFFHVCGKREVSKNQQLEAMIGSKEEIGKLFKSVPCTFIPSGHRHDTDCDLISYQAGYFLFSSNFTGILRENMAIRNWKIPSVFFYLKEPTAFAASSGYPFVGVVHDYEIKKEGVAYLQKLLVMWREVNNIERIISLAELAISLCSTIRATYDKLESCINLILNTPKNKNQDHFNYHFRGTNLTLRIVLPKNSRLIEDDVFVSGGILRSIQQTKQNSTATLSIGLEGEPKIFIMIPIDRFHPDGKII